MEAIRVFGADWCHDTQRTRQYLDSLGLAYEYHDVDRDPVADAFVRERNGGVQRLPTVDLGEKILIVPDNDELDEALQTLST
jgi:mycoredoxin